MLRFVEANQPVTLPQAFAHFQETKGYAKTTVQTFLERLHKKRVLWRQKEKGLYHYRVVRSVEHVLNHLMERFTADILGGTISPYVAFIGRRTELTKDEIAELKAVVKQLDKK